MLSIYEAISLELNQFYVLQKANILWGIDNGLYEAFDFTRKKARRAYGEVTLTFHTANYYDTHIPQGTRFISRKQGYDQTYQTLKDYIVPSGQNTAVVTVFCTEVGTIGNVPKNTIDTVGTNLMNLTSATNIEDFLTGQDEEPLDDVRKRFRNFVDTRGRATNKAIEYGAREVADITGVYVDESTGYIKLYAHDNNGNLPEWLKKEVEDAVADYRPSGIRLDVFPVNKKIVDLNVEVILNNGSRLGTPFNNEITLAIRNYLNRMVTSEDLILADLGQLLMNLDDEAIYDINIIAPEENIVVKRNEVIRSGNVNVTLTIKSQDELESMIRFDV